MKGIELKSIGKLKPHPEIPDEWLISESVPVKFFDEKKLKFILNVDLENDKRFLSDGDQSIKNFLEKESNEKSRISNRIYKYYREIQDYWDSQSFGPSPLKLNDEEEIWNYVYPYEIHVCRNTDEDKNMYLLIHCGCEWEEEHGLQLVFRNGLELTKVSGIDCSPVE